MEVYDYWSMKSQDERGAIELAAQENFEKGLETGIEKRDQELVLNMHKNNFDIPAIRLATNLPEEKIRSILNSQ